MYHSRDHSDLPGGHGKERFGPSSRESLVSLNSGSDFTSREKPD